MADEAGCHVDARLNEAFPNDGVIISPTLSPNLVSLGPHQPHQERSELSEWRSRLGEICLGESNFAMRAASTCGRRVDCED